MSQAQLIEQQLAQASTLNNKGSTKAALVLYDKVLSEDPSNPVALASAGFLQWNVGTTAHVASLVRVGRAEIETAIKDSPTYYQAHLFYGLVLENQDHNHAAAVAQFNDFLADDPPAAELPQAAPLVAPAYQAAGLPLPAAVHDQHVSPVTPAGRRRRGRTPAANASQSPSVVVQPTLIRSEWLGSTPIASSTGDGSMLSDEQAEPEWAATPARSSPMSTGSASTPCTPRQTR